MPAATDYPFGQDELEFVDAYWRTSLRIPQVAADAALRTLVTAGQADRLLLVGTIAAGVGEAARRLTAVCAALEDRTYPVGKSLLRPLPGRAEWYELIQQVVTIEPSAMRWRLGLDDSAQQPAERLRAMGDLSWVGPLVDAACQEGIVVEGTYGGRPGARFIAVKDRVEAAQAFGEDDAAGLADTAAELVAIARGFLGAYLEGRQSAGYRPD